METQTRPNLCHGLDEIARHLGLEERQAKHLNDTGRLPTFKLGRNVCALRSTLDAWLAEQERLAGWTGTGPGRGGAA